MGTRNQPFRIVVVVGLWSMWVLWTISRFTSTVIATMPATCLSGRVCPASDSVAVTRQFDWSFWHFVFTVIGAGLLIAASVIILRSPRTVDEI